MFYTFNKYFFLVKLIKALAVYLNVKETHIFVLKNIPCELDIYKNIYISKRKNLFMLWTAQSRQC